MPSPLANSIVEVDDTNFGDMVLKARVGVLLDVYADWCQPCKQLTPMLERVVTAAKGGLRLAKLNADKQQDLSGQLGVKTLPTVFGVVAGRVVDSFSGLVPEARLREFLEKVITTAEGAGLVPEPGVEAGLDGVGEVSARLEAVGSALDEGRAGEAVAALEQLLPILREVEAGYKAAAAVEEAKRAAAAGSDAALHKRRASPNSAVPPEVQELGARAAAAVARAHLALGQESVRAGSGNAALASFAASVAGGAPIVGGTEYRHAKGHVDVNRGVAAAHLAAAAAGAAPAAAATLAAGEGLAASGSAATPAKLLALAAAQVAVGDWAGAADSALTIVRHHAPSSPEGAAAAELARRVFAVAGDASPVSVAGKKRLAKLLFR